MARDFFRSEVEEPVWCDSAGLTSTAAELAAVVGDRKKLACSIFAAIGRFFCDATRSNREFRKCADRSLAECNSPKSIDFENVLEGAMIESR